MLQKSLGEKCVIRSLVFKWHKRFSEGRESLQGDSRPGRRSIVDAVQLTSVKEALDADRRLTVRELAGASVGTVYNILTKKLKMRKVHARWEPRLLSDTEKERRVRESPLFLQRCRRQGDASLDNIITTDETWLYPHDPETKSQYAVWRSTGSPPPEKARESRCTYRAMLCLQNVPSMLTIFQRYKQDEEDIKRDEQEEQGDEEDEHEQEDDGGEDTDVVVAISRLRRQRRTSRKDEQKEEEKRDVKVKKMLKKRELSKKQNGALILEPRHRRQAILRPMRDRLNPLDYMQEEQLLKKYRFDRQSILELCNILHNDLSHPTRRHNSLPASLQICIALRYYALGSFLSVLADSHGIGISTVSRTLHAVSYHLARRGSTFIRFPRNVNELGDTKQGFYNIANFPRVLGFVDETFIPIKAPNEDEHLYVTRKRFHAINVQGILRRNKSVPELISSMA